MQTEAEDLTDHYELICSTTIERIVTGRETALKAIEALILQLDEASRLTSMISGNTADHCAMRQSRFFNYWLMRPVDKAMLVELRNVDSDGYQPALSGRHMSGDVISKINAIHIMDSV